MRQFLVFIGKILLVLLLTAFALDFIYTKVYINATPQNKVQFIHSLKNRKFNYIFIGSSRVENSVIPEQIEKKTNKTVLNLGVKGLKLKDIDYVVKLLHKNKVSFDTVFVQLDYSFNVEEDYSKFFSYELLPFCNSSDSSIENYLKSTNKKYFYYKYIPFLKYIDSDELVGFRKIIASFKNKVSVFEFNKGYVPIYGSSNINKEKIPSFIVGDNKYFQEIDSFFKKNNQKVIYFSAPVTLSTDNLDYFKKLKNVVPDLYNFHDVISDENYFQDNLHVNHDGAVKFTNILIDTFNLQR